MICNKYEMRGALGKDGIVRALKGEYDGKLFVIKQFKTQDIEDQKRVVYRVLYERMKKRVNLPIGKHVYTYIDAPIDDHNKYIIGPINESINLKAYMDTKSNRVLTLDEALIICSRVLVGLQELHGSGRLHLNLKPSNILITPQKDVLIADQGMYLVKDDKVLTKLTSYLAPQANGRYSSKESNAITVAADVWGFAVLFYYMLNGVTPFDFKEDAENKHLKEACSEFSYKKHAKYEQPSEGLQQLFKQMFKVDYIERIGMHRIKQNKLFQNVISKNQLSQSEKVYRDVQIMEEYTYVFEAKKEEIALIEDIEPYERTSNISIQSSEEVPYFKEVPSFKELPQESPQKPMIKKQSNQRESQPLKIMKKQLREEKKEIIRQPIKQPIKQPTKQPIKQPKNQPIMPQPIPIPQKPRTLRPMPIQPPIRPPTTNRPQATKQHIQFKRHFQRIKTLQYLSNKITESQFFYQQQKIAMAYCMHKLALFYCINFNKKCYSKFTGYNTDPSLDWKQYFSSKQFQELLKSGEEALVQIRRKHSRLHRECADCRGIIIEKFKEFQKIHKQDLHSDLQGDFKKCYRSLTTTFYERLSKKIKELKHKDFQMKTLNRLVQMKTVLVICHTINKIFASEFISIAFKIFFAWLNNKVGYEVKEVRSEELTEWISEESVENLSKFCQNSISLLFT